MIISALSWAIEAALLFRFSTRFSFLHRPLPATPRAFGFGLVCQCQTFCCLVLLEFMALFTQKLHSPFAVE